MTQQLSPAAQAVLKVACIHHGLFNEEIIQRRRMVAAALRAAAEQIEDLYCADLVIDDSDGAVFVLRQLMLIAAELEAQ